MRFKRRPVRGPGLNFKGVVVTTVLTHAVTASGQGMPDERGASEAPQLEAVTVTARRSIEQRFFATGSLVVVDRKDIENLGAFSVADVLRQLPGVQVTPTADGGVEIRMRGMDRNATQLLIDGQRVASGKSQLPIDQLPSELIERIEVVRAPTAEFSGATGGTLNIVLRQATIQRETVIRLTDNHVWGRNAGQAFFSKTGPLGGGGDALPGPRARGGAASAPAAPAPKTAEAPAATASAAAAVPGDPGAPASAPAEERPLVPSDAVLAAAALPSLPADAQPWSYFLAVSSTGYVVGSDTHRRTVDGGSVVAESDASGRYRRSDFSLVPRLNGRLSATDQLALRATLTRGSFSGRYDSQGTGVDAGGAYSALTAESYGYERRYLQAGADWTHRFADSKLETTLSGSQSRDEINRVGDFTQSYGAAAAVNPYTFLDNRQEDLWSLSSKLTGTRSALMWSLGAQAEYRSLGVNTLSSGAAPVNLNVDMKRHVVWGQNEWELPASTTLTAGLRAETLLIQGADAGLTDGRRMSFLQPSLHTRTPINDDLQFRANLARVTRNPSIWSLIDRSTPSQGSNSISNPDSIGNPNLRSEVAWTLDAGFERRLAPQGQVGVNLFVRSVKDTIAALTTLAGNRWVEQRSNVGDATVWGLEADAKTGLAWLGFGSDWTLSTNASLLQSRMTSGPNQGSRIPGQARYTASVNVAKPMRRTGGLFGGAALSLTGPAQLNTSPGITGRDNARAMLDLYLGGVVPKLGYWRIGVYNIGNARYDRERSYPDGAGGFAQNSSVMTLTPRVYLTVGTQF
jgi:outer membrane receptor for ferrienterochelin and colicin